MKETNVLNNLYIMTHPKLEKPTIGHLRTVMSSKEYLKVVPP